MKPLTDQVLSQRICEDVTHFSDTFFNRVGPCFAIAVPRTGCYTSAANYLYWASFSYEGLVGFWYHKLTHVNIMLQNKTKKCYSRCMQFLSYK